MNIIEEMDGKKKPHPSRLRGRGVEVSKTLCSMRAYSAGCKKAAAQIASMYEEGYVGIVLGMPNKRKAMSWRQKSQ